MDAASHGRGEVRMVLGDTVISSTGIFFLEARHTKDGSVLWTRNLQNDYANDLQPPVPTFVTVQLSQSMAAYDVRSLLFVPIDGYASGTGYTGKSLLLAIDAATGDTAWSAPLAGRGGWVSVDEEGRVFTLVYPGGPVHTPADLRRWTLSGSSVWAVPVWSGDSLTAHEGTVYVGASEEAFDAVDGTTRWSRGNGIESPMLAHQGSAWVLDDALSLMKIRSDGSIAWGYAPLLSTHELHLSQLLSILTTTSKWEGGVGRHALEEVDSNGQRVFTCPLPFGPGGSVLLDGRLVVRGPGPSSNQYALVAFDLPGRKLAPTGWVTRRGNPSQTGAPR